MEPKKLKISINFLILTLVLVLLSCCSLKSKLIFGNCEIELLAQNDSIVPSQYELLDFYCKGEEGEVVRLHYKELNEVHKSQFNNLDYTDYLFKLLNQEILINADNKYVFQLDKSVYEIYQSNNFAGFLSYYCENYENGKYQLIKLLSESELNAFSYLLFVNGYFVDFDDVLGFYFVTYKDNIFDC